MKHIPSVNSGLLLVLFLFSGTTKSQAQPAAVPLVLSPTGTRPIGYAVKAQWVDPGVRGLWFQVYVQRDGTFYFSQWIRADEAMTLGGLEMSLGELPSGDYKVWVQAWDPCYGPTDWDSTEFTLECLPVLAPLLFAKSRPFDGFWPSVFRTHSHPVNRGITWSEIEVYRDGVLVGSEWKQVDPNQVETFNFETADIPFLEPGFLEGSYTWRSRDYSPCGGGIGPWSSEDPFVVSNTDCEAPPIPIIGSNYTNLDHSPTATTDAGNVATIDVGGITGTSWVQVAVVSVATGTTVDTQWLHYSQGFSTVSSFLAPGDYYLYRQEYNRCGLGPWSEVPEMFTVTSKNAGPITNLDFRGFDCDGAPYLAWDAQVGNDWYEVYIACGATVLFNQWVNVNEVEMGSPVWPDPATDRILCQIDAECAGSLNVWVRSYANSGQFGQWTNVTAPQAYVPDAPIPGEVTFSGNMPIFSWSATTPVGAYELYVARYGQFYLDGIIECEETGSAPGPEFPPPGDVPNMAQSFFNFCPGDFTVYVRSVGGGGAAGPWSAPQTFSIPN